METEQQDFLSSPTDLIVIDSNIVGYENILGTDISNSEILVIDGNKDGIAQITEALNAYEEVASIQIFSHGDSGSIQLGSTELNSANLQQYHDDLIDWGKVLSENGDILIYGCNVAGGAGVNFINALSDLTGADVAASTDLTGNSDALGDWDLEYATGEIEANLALSPQTTSSFEGTLHEGTEYAVEEDPNFQNESVLSGLNSAVSMEFLPDGRLLVLEKNGTVKITDPNSDSGGGTSDYLVLTDILTSGEKGLIDIAIDPDFESNGQVYLYYTAGSTRQFRISSFTHQGNTADPNSEQILWEDPDVAAGPDHFGAGLSFGPDGRLYLTTGDKASGSFSQDLTRAEGKVIRINKDGSIPEDNPFNDGDGPNLDEIWAIGLRNPFRSEWDLASGQFFIGDVGQDEQEEINRITLSDAGGNFGWPFVEGNIVNQQPPAGTQLIDPIFTYEHTDDQFGSGAVIGGIVYRGNAFPSQFQGAYFFADYTQDFIKYMTFDGGIDVDNFDRGIRSGGSTGRVDNVVAIDEGPDGALYYINFGSELRRISYNTTGNQAPTIDSATADVTSGGSPLTVNFSGAATDAEGDAIEYRWIFGDGTEATGANVSHTYDDNGNYNATLIVSDGTSDTQSDPIEITVGSAPDAAITLPSDNGTFRAGDTINFSGTATDNGPLTPDNYAWEIDFIHDDHQHPRESFSGTGGSFVIPTTRTSGHDFNSFTGYEINLTVTDTDGLQDTETISIFPEKVDVTFGSNVPGDIVFTIDDIPRTRSSFVYDTAIDFQHTISVPETVNVGGTQYTFESWSNGEETAQIVFTVPDVDVNLTANYTESGGGTGGGDLVEIFRDSFESSTVGSSPIGWNGDGWTVKTAAGEYDNTNGNFSNADGT
ncbi:MAG: PQQ-dependent sugar dehydrogenase, partial [Pleurocapsa sp.]